MLGDRPSQQRRNGVADLTRDLDLRALEHEVVREGLEASGLSMSDRSMCDGMEVATLLGLEELRADRDATDDPTRVAP